MKNLEKYAGRWFVEEDVPYDFRQFANCIPSMIEKNNNLFCRRCQTKILAEWKLPNQAFYCRLCLVFGRNTSIKPLYAFPPLSFPKQLSLNWQGKLTPLQKEVSDVLMNNLKGKQPILVHAVTGAGKTEMIYPLVSHVIDLGGTVCLASPRIDVCLELERRLRVDFACPINLMYGGSDRECVSPLTIATTHQLLKFYHAFDVLIVDEVDSFPYVDNAMLYQGVKTALKEDGYTVYLTATSTDELDKKVRFGELQKVSLSRRFHENPLVVPKLKWLSKLDTKLQRKKLPLTLLNGIKKQLITDYPLLLFFPTIDGGRKFVEVLRNYFPTVSIGFVSSQSEDRKQIVTDFRDGRIRILVTTTILERGVTFPYVDVFVLLANHHLYTRSSLVQISGRVGRSEERPTGELIFFHDGKTKAMTKAIHEIKEMNRKGGF